MKIITGDRAEGKTTKLIELCKGDGGFIVCRSQREAKRIHKLSLCSIPFPLTYDEFIMGTYYGRGIGKIYIDDVDQLVKHISEVPIEAISLTLEDSIEVNYLTGENEND